MSKIKLNLIDTQRVWCGDVDSEFAHRCIAALSAEPETVEELEKALQRFQATQTKFFESPASQSPTNANSVKPDLLIIDLSSRVVASNYEQPNAEGQVLYFDDDDSELLPIQYQLSNDWICTDSLELYKTFTEDRRRDRELRSRLNTRAILYGGPLLEFVAVSVHSLVTSLKATRETSSSCRIDLDRITTLITNLHKTWLTSRLNELLGRTPREIMLSKREAIDFDMASRMLQWTSQMQGPPCLSRDSAAYRFAGFGTHEWIIYYSLVEYLLSKAFYCCLKHDDNDQVRLPEGESHFSVEDLSGSRVRDKIFKSCVATLSSDNGDGIKVESLIELLEHLKLNWLTEANSELEGRVPFFIIDNERKRLPEATIREPITIDQGCPSCGRDSKPGSESLRELTFWRLDPSEMNQDFVFSTTLDFDKWRAERSETFEDLSATREELCERSLEGTNAYEIGFRQLIKIDSLSSTFESDPDLPES